MFFRICCFLLRVWNFIDGIASCRIELLEIPTFLVCIFLQRGVGGLFDTHCDSVSTTSIPLDSLIQNLVHGRLKHGINESNSWHGQPGVGELGYSGVGSWFHEADAEVRSKSFPQKLRDYLSQNGKPNTGRHSQSTMCIRRLWLFYFLIRNLCEYMNNPPTLAKLRSLYYNLFYGSHVFVQDFQYCFM